MQRRQTQPGLRGASFVDPKVLAKISNLELVARFVVDGFINGLHRAPYLGVSLDFAEHRGYEPGDDIRRIDWRLFGRTDRFYVKQFEADSNSNFTLLLDVSRSMGFASAAAGLSKIEYARYLAASLAYLAHRQRDRVGLITFDEAVVEHVPPAAAHFDVVLHTLDRARAGRAGNIAAPVSRMAEHFRRRGMVAVISDLYEEPDVLLKSFKQLRHLGNDVLVFHLLDPAEIDFPFDQPSSFEDLESLERRPLVPEELREQYRSLVQEHIATLSRLCTESRIDYVLLNTATPLDFALFKYLSARTRLARVR